MDEAQRAEYDTLRSEALQQDRVISEVYALMLAAEGVIVGQGFSSENGLVFLAAFLVLPLIFYYIWDKRCVIWRIAGYIRVFLEDEIDNLGWESRLAVLRGVTRQPYAVPFGVLGVEFASFHILLLANLAGCVYFLQSKPDTAAGAWLLFGSACVVWLGFAIHSWLIKKNVLEREGGGGNPQYQLWIQVREQEKQPRG